MEDMNSIRRKLRSQKGASITFALLLFLVCSMVSIVVVVAGSAAAGRMSQRAETDQRYYAVTSAAELLCDDFKGKTVTVEYTREGSEEDPNVDAIKISPTSDSTKTYSNTDYPIIEAVSRRLTQKIVKSETPTTDPDGTLTLEVTASAPTGAALGCTINEYVKKDGRVIFEIFNTVAPEAAKKNIYTLQAVFDARIVQSTSQYTAADGTKMEKGTFTLEWSLSGIEKGAYAGA